MAYFPRGIILDKAFNAFEPLNREYLAVATVERGDVLNQETVNKVQELVCWALFVLDSSNIARHNEIDTLQREQTLLTDRVQIVQDDREVIQQDLQSQIASYQASLNPCEDYSADKLLKKLIQVSQLDQQRQLEIIFTSLLLIGAANKFNRIANRDLNNIYTRFYKGPVPIMGELFKSIAKANGFYVWDEDFAREESSNFFQRKAQEDGRKPIQKIDTHLDPRLQAVYRRGFATEAYFSLVRKFRANNPYYHVPPVSTIEREGLDISLQNAVIRKDVNAVMQILFSQNAGLIPERAVNCALEFARDNQTIRALIEDRYIKN